MHRTSIDTEYHSRTQPPFTMKEVPKLRNVTTCVDPLQSAVFFSVRPCKDLVASRADIVLHHNVSSSPRPPAEVLLCLSLGLFSALLQSQRPLQAR
jgi:hypothetical protein